VIENAEDALKIACSKFDATIVDYTVAPIFMNGERNGGHEWLIEFTKSPNNFEGFTNCLDDSLKSLNSDYEAKRYLDMTIAMPKIHQAPEGLFYQWLKSKNKLGGQHKVPRLSNKRDYLEELLEMSQSEAS